MGILKSKCLVDVIAPACYSCFNNTNYLTDLVVGYMGVPKYSGISMPQHPQYVTIRVKSDLTENLTLKASAQLTNEPHMSNFIANLNYKGKDCRSQIQMGSGALIGASYIQWLLIVCHNVARSSSVCSGIVST